MTLPDPRSCAWAALTVTLAALSAACFTAAGRAIAELAHNRRNHR